MQMGGDKTGKNLSAKKTAKKCSMKTRRGDFFSDIHIYSAVKAVRWFWQHDVMPLRHKWMRDIYVQDFS